MAGFTISVPWDAQKSSDSMEEPLNWLLFNRHLTGGLCRAVLRYRRWSHVHEGGQMWTELHFFYFHRHKKVLETVVDIEYVTKVNDTSKDSRQVSLFFTLFLCPSFHSRREQSGSSTNVSPLCCLGINHVQTTTSMPAQAEKSTIPPYPSCVSMRPMILFRRSTVSGHMEDVCFCLCANSPN